MSDSAARRTRGDGLGLAVVGALALILYGALYWTYASDELFGPNDFIPLYVAASEVGGPSLYDPDAYRRFQQERYGGFNESLVYSRPPYYAVLLRPFTWLGSFGASYGVYTLLRLAAIAAFLWLWPADRRQEAALFVCLSFPLFTSLLNGQDVAFLLPWITLAMRLERERPFAAGLAFAMCAIKFHLLILLPAALLAQRRWAVLRGLSAGAAALIGVSFLAAGSSWPGDYASVLLSNEIHPLTPNMPNLHGMLSGAPGAAAWEAVGAAAALAAVVFAARRSDFAFGLAAASLGSLIVSRHSYVADMTVLLPGLLASVGTLSTKSARFFAVAMLSPIPALFLFSGRPLAHAAQAALLCALIGYVVTAWLRHGGAKRIPAKSKKEL